MAQNLRTKDPEVIHLMGNRTVEAKLWMVPTKEVNDIIGGVIGKYQKLYGIEIFAFIFLSNHYHMLIRSKKSLASKFMEAVDKEVARRINKLLKRRGHLWAGSYDGRVVPEDADTQQAFAYILTNPIHHGLVKHLGEWPGLNSLNCKGKSYPFVNYTEYGKARFRDPKASKEDFTEYHQIEISPLPCFSSFTKQSKIMPLYLKGFIKDLHQKNERKDLIYLGAAGALKQRFGKRPGKVKKSRKGPCYAKSFESVSRFMERYKPWVEVYKEASRRFRLGELDVEFPEYSFKPPLHHIPAAYPT